MSASKARSVDEVIDRLAGEFPGRRLADVERLVQQACLLFAEAEADGGRLLRVAEWYVRTELTGHR